METCLTISPARFSFSSTGPSCRDSESSPAGPAVPGSGGVSSVRAAVFQTARPTRRRSPVCGCRGAQMTGAKPVPISPRRLSRLRPAPVAVSYSRSIFPSGWSQVVAAATFRQRARRSGQTSAPVGGNSAAAHGRGRRGDTGTGDGRAASSAGRRDR